MGPFYQPQMTDDKNGAFSVTRTGMEIKVLEEHRPSSVPPYSPHIPN
jgi:hypothetical protein